MGTDLKDWAMFEGPIYMGANSSWEVIWTVVAAAICVIALIAGSRHELAAYKRLKQQKLLNRGRNSKTGEGRLLGRPSFFR